MSRIIAGTQCFKDWRQVLDEAASARLNSSEELQALALCGPTVEEEADARALDYCAQISWVDDLRRHARWTLRALIEGITLFGNGRSKMRAEATGGELLHLLPPPPGLIEDFQSSQSLALVVNPSLREQVLQGLKAEVQVTAQLYALVFGRKVVDDEELLERFRKEPLVELWHWIAWWRLAEQAGRGERVADVVRRVRFRAFVLADFMPSAMSHHLQPSDIGRLEAKVADFWDYASLLRAEEMPYLPFFMPEFVHHEIHHRMPIIEGPLVELLMRPSDTEAPLRILLFWRARGYTTNIDDLELLAQARLLCSIVASWTMEGMGDSESAHKLALEMAVSRRQQAEETLARLAAARAPVAFPALQL